MVGLTEPGSSKGKVGPSGGWAACQRVGWVLEDGDSTFEVLAGRRAFYKHFNVKAAQSQSDNLSSNETRDL